ncbi:hypothetical protein CPC08DRAFT_726012 [Agrocybe pediades]|nr:hypothetical protein CPC08DRAFT_726012 [Agrocybe pediades]
MLFREHIASVFPILILFTALLHERLSVAPVTGFEFSAPTYPSWSHAMAATTFLSSRSSPRTRSGGPMMARNTIGSGLEQREEEVSEARLWLADKNVGVLPRWEGGFLVGRGFVAEVFAFSDAKELLAI